MKIFKLKIYLFTAILLTHCVISPPNNDWYKQLGDLIVDYDENLTVDKLKNPKDEPVINAMSDMLELFHKYKTFTTNIGQGSYGKVFMYRDYKTLKSFSFKQVFYNKHEVIDPKVEIGVEGVNSLNMSLVEEISALRYSNKKDPNNYFYIKFYGAYQMEDYFEQKKVEIQKAKDDVEAKIAQKMAEDPNYLGFGGPQIDDNLRNLENNMEDYLKIEYEGVETPAWIVMNYQKTNLGQIFEHHWKHISIVDLLTRLELVYNIAKGVALIHDQYYHCDLKPGNIMLRHMDQVDLWDFKQYVKDNEANQSIVPFLMQLKGDKYYVVQIIDLGNQEVQGKTRKCLTGTSGYIPPEYLANDDKNDDKFDVFSIVIMMLDIEMKFSGFKNYKEMFYTFERFYRHARFIKTEDNKYFGDVDPDMNEEKYKLTSIDKFLYGKPQIFEYLKQTKFLLEVDFLQKHKDPQAKLFTEYVKDIYPDFEKEVIEKLKTGQSKTKNIKGPFTIFDFIQTVPHKMDLLYFGALRFFINMDFLHQNAHQLNLIRKVFGMEQVDIKDFSSDVSVTDDEFKTFSNHQQYWIRKGQLDFKMAPARQKMMLECVDILTKSLDDREDMKGLMAFLDGYHASLTKDFGEEREKLRVMADEHKIESLQQSAWIHDQMKKYNGNLPKPGSGRVKSKRARKPSNKKVDDKDNAPEDDQTQKSQKSQQPDIDYIDIQDADDGVSELTTVKKNQLEDENDSEDSYLDDVLNQFDQLDQLDDLSLEVDNNVQKNLQANIKAVKETNENDAPDVDSNNNTQVEDDNTATDVDPNGNNQTITDQKD